MPKKKNKNPTEIMLVKFKNPITEKILDKARTKKLVFIPNIFNI